MSDATKPPSPPTDRVQASLRDLKRRLAELELEALQRGYGIEAEPPCDIDDIDAVVADAARGLAQRRAKRHDYVGVLEWEAYAEQSSAPRDGQAERNAEGTSGGHGTLPFEQHHNRY